MIRALIVCSLLAATVVPLETASAETPMPCDSRTNGGDYFEIRCPLGAVGAAEWVFRVHFAGVHDDSAANMAVRVDGELMACGAGSTIRLAGQGAEDGSGSDGHLECKLVLEGIAPVQRELFVVLTWRHAQHVGHELVVVSRH